MIKEIKWVPINEIKPNKKNRNSHSEEQIKRLADIITYQGFRTPLIVSNRTGLLVAGHGRLLAAKQLSLKSVPVSYQDFDSEEQEYAAGVSDNAIASWSELDLSGINQDIPELGPDFNIDMLGIKDFVLEPADKYGDKDADGVPEVRATSVALGDLYSLGNHRLLCGDSTDATQVERLMSGEKADMVFTDPPYNIASETNGIASTAPTNKQNKKLMESEWDKDFVPTISFLEFLSSNGACYVFTSHFLFGEWFRLIRSEMDFTNWCVWTKPNPFPSLTKRHWAFDSELCLYATRGMHVANYPDAGNARSTWEIPIGEGGLHPTQKPVAVPTRAIEFSSMTNQIILDPYLGSGSTLIACEKTNRKCYGMEIDPQYCQVIIDRWEKFTGQKAVKV